MALTAKVASPYLLTLLSCYCLMSLLIGPAAAQSLPCPHAGDVNQDRQVTPADALLAFRHFLGLNKPPLTACAQDQANVSNPATPAITPADALCIFRTFLGLPSCLDGLRLAAEPCDCAGSAGDKVDTSVLVTRRGAGATTLSRAFTNAGNGVPNVPVTFRLATGDGVFSQSGTSTVTVLTDANGRATATVQLGTERIQIVEARAQGSPDVVFFEIIGFVLPTAIVVQSDHSLVVVDAGLNALLRVDPSTGARTVLSGSVKGSGPNVAFPEGIVREVSGTLVVAGIGAVLRVDPQTGDRTIVSDDTHGSGARLQGLKGIVRETNGSLVVVDRDLRAVVRVNPQTGDRTIVSDATHGSGPTLVSPEGIALETGGALVVTDADLGALLRVNPQTGNRIIVSDATHGSGPTLVTTVPIPVVVETNGNLVVGVLGRLLRVHPVTGVRTLINQGPLVFTAGIALEADGSLVIANSFRQSVERVNPRTGIATVVSQAPPIGKGEGFVNVEAMTVARDGSFMVLNRLGLVRVDRSTGDRTIVYPTPDIIIDADSEVADGIATEAQGTLVTVDDFVGNRVVRVDPSNGRRTLLSGCTTFDRKTGCVGSVVGSGPLFDDSQGIAVEANGNLVVVQGGSGLHAILRVDRRTGNRTIVSDATHGSGLAFGGDKFPTMAIAVETGGPLVVTDNNLQAVLRVDPVTGNRTLVSGCSIFFCGVATRGTGPPFRTLRAIAVEASHTLVIVDGFTNAVIRVNPVTGNRTLVSGCAERASLDPTCTGEFRGSGVNFADPRAIAVESNGTLAVTDRFLEAVIRVDPVTGDRTILSRGIR